MLSNIDGEYFRHAELVAGGAIAGHELSEALRQAYALRSRYVHNLHRLPDAITLADQNQEVTEVDRRPALTFQGLIRLTHHAISAFVRNGRTSTYEPYDYTLEQSWWSWSRWLPNSGSVGLSNALATRTNGSKVILSNSCPCYAKQAARL